MKLHRRRAEVAIRRRPAWLVWVAFVAFAVAFAARFVPVLRGGGLFGLDTYDDSVHYASALALAHGVLPYRDFLLLHPPGVVVALWPFAVFGAATNDSWGFAAARFGWILMGSTTAALIVVALRRAGLLGALVGGVAYAVYLPAVRSERTTMLEGLTSALLVVVLLLLGAPRICSRYPWLCYVGVGMLLGLSAGVKIWGVVIAVVVVGWVLIGYGLENALRVGLGTVVGVGAVCLPFYLAAPSAMVRMVVIDQLGRPDSTADLMTRLALIAGMPAKAPPDPGLAIAGTVLIALLILISITGPSRLAPLLVVAMGSVVLMSPSFFPHYPAAFAVPLMVTVGSVIPIMRIWVSRLGSWAPKVFAAVTTVALITLALPASQLHYGSRIPIGRLSAAIADEPGCVTADDPAILVELDVFSRNIARHCPIVVDLSGYQLDLDPGFNGPQTRNAAFQEFALGYLASGQVSATWRLWTGWGYSADTRRELQRWPVAAEEGTRVLRLPHASLGSGR
jgi:hypothetical protein